MSTAILIIFQFACTERSSNAGTHSERVSSDVSDEHRGEPSHKKTGVDDEQSSEKENKRSKSAAKKVGEWSSGAQHFSKERYGELILNAKISEDRCLTEFSRCRCDANGVCFPNLRAKQSPISEELAASLTGVSWKEGCPVPISDLVLLNIPHWNMQGQIIWGDLIVNKDCAEDVSNVFFKMYLSEFPIERMQLVYRFDGDDDQSMRANNTSSFNCRHVGGSNRWSEHAHGHAVDINPLMNPWVRGDKFEPKTAEDFVDRSKQQPGMIKDGDMVVKAFKEIGWSWGGYWSKSKDYQHFSKTGK